MAIASGSASLRFAYTHFRSDLKEVGECFRECADRSGRTDKEWQDSRTVFKSRCPRLFAMRLRASTRLTRLLGFKLHRKLVDISRFARIGEISSSRMEAIRGEDLQPKLRCDLGHGQTGTEHPKRDLARPQNWVTTKQLTSS